MKGHLTDVELKAHRFNMDEEGNPLLSGSEINSASCHLLSCPDCFERSERRVEEKLASRNNQA